MSTLPEPLADASLSVQGYEYMPLLGARLFASEFYALAVRNPRGGLAGQKLWWVAWQQVPAGSLPANEYALCTLADFGSDMRGWNRSREVAMHGFILCRDGRYYHPLIVELAQKALDIRVKARDKKARQRAAAAEGARHPDAERREHIASSRDYTPAQVTDISEVGRKCPPGRPGFVPAEGKVSIDTGSLRSPVSPPTAGASAAQQSPPPDQMACASPAAPAQPDGKGRPSRGSRLPVDWRPSDADAAYAQERGLDPHRLAEDFRDYWCAKAGKDGVMLDWSMTWKRWCRTQADRQKRRGGGSLFDRAPASVPETAGTKPWVVAEVVTQCNKTMQVHSNNLWGSGQNLFSHMIADALNAGADPVRDIYPVMREAAKWSGGASQIQGLGWFKSKLRMPPLKVVA